MTNADFILKATEIILITMIIILIQITQTVEIKKLNKLIEISNQKYINVVKEN